MDEIDISQLQKFNHHFKSSLYLKALIAGNINSTEAIETFKKIESQLINSNVIDK